jgi:DNA topoisomerase-1
MPKKSDKTHEEKAVEKNFRVDESDVKYATEKFVKSLPPEKLIDVTQKLVKQTPKEIIIQKAVQKKSPRKPSKKEREKIESFTVIKKKFKKSKSAKEYSAPNIRLKSSGYELIITEKPQAALKIANALGKAVQKNINKVPYYEVNRDGKKIIVTCAVGHLFTLKQNSSGFSIPVFDISWIPNFLAKKGDFTKRYYDTILKLTKDAGSITIATDYDIEGEVIGMNVMKYICNQPDAARMKFSTLTPNELNKSYENKSREINWGQAIAGETRHYLDWFYGINLSRALMNAIKTTGKFKIMSIGRVQGPALKLIVDKEKEIQNFKSEDYWQVSIKIHEKPFDLWLYYVKDIFNKSELKKFENIVGKKVLCHTEKKEQLLPPQPPFNLTTLQTEAYKFYGITPSRTLQIAQSLYLAGMISYPRTSSQKLPPEIGYKEILKKLAEKFKAEKLIKRDKPVEGKKTDPAHPSIYPTGTEGVMLSGDDKKIYELIVKRFLALFCEDAIIDQKKIIATLKDDAELKFTLLGKSIRKKSWLEIYPSKLKEEKIPDVKGEKEILDSKTEQKETQPPKRYSQASIISELEKRNLGTKATRSSILETLYDRGYIENQSIQATALGISLIDTLEKYSPIIIDEKLTEEFEKDMDKIQEEKNKSEQIKREQKIIDHAKSSITSISKDFEKNENKIGKELIEANIEFREKQKIENRLRECPVCKKGNLIINYSKKNRRFFVACDAYPNCTNTYPLPPNGIIKKVEGEKSVCEECGYPKLMRLSKGKKPWIFCWNPKCPTNASWAQKREEKKNNSE